MNQKKFERRRNSGLVHESRTSHSLINIAPVDAVHVPLFKLQEPMAMALTHLVLKNDKYRETFQQYGGYVILDNSLIEMGDSMSIEDVVEAAEMIDADEIILRDAFQNCDATLERVAGDLQWLELNGYTDRFKLMAVAHGESISEWVRCFELLETFHEIDVIGIPKVLAKMHPAGRAAVASIWGSSAKEIHLLGLWYSLAELETIPSGCDFRSMDTVLATFIHQYDLGYRAPRPDGFTIDLETARIKNTTEYIHTLEYFTKLFKGLV